VRLGAIEDVKKQLAENIRTVSWPAIRRDLAPFLEDAAELRLFERETFLKVIEELRSEA
jgi:hypothetical protein